MKRSLLSFFIISLLGAYALKAQDCVYYFPTTEGASVETSSYDATGKHTGINIQRVVKKEEGGNQMKLSVANENYDVKGSKKTTTTLEYACRGGEFHVDMKRFIDPAIFAQYQNMDISFSSSDYIIPRAFVPGQSLDEVYVTMTVKNNGISIMNLKVRIFNRKVDAVETIKTNMGNYECYKVTYDVETDMGITVKSKGAEWYTKNVGVVKSETYDASGKLMGSTLLTKFKDQ